MLIIQQRRCHVSGADPASHSHKDILVLLSHGHLPKNPPSEASCCVLHLLGIGIQFFFSWSRGTPHLERPPGFGGGGRKTSPWFLWDAKPWFGVSQESTSMQARPHLTRSLEGRAESSPDKNLRPRRRFQALLQKSPDSPELKGKTTSPHVKWMLGRNETRCV